MLLQNLKPGSMDKLGFSLERLRKDYPALICCTISGYGDDGPYADRKAYDLLIQAESGLASITGGPEGPSRVGISVVDIATGATAHASILEALIARGRTGKGADIRISMFDVMADWLTVPLLNSEAGNPPQRMGAGPSLDRALRRVPARRTARDILISIQSEREWKKLCAEVLGQPDLPNDPRFANMVERVRNRALTDKTVGDSFATMTRDELLKRLPMPTSPLPRSTPWPISPCIRICAASRSIRRTARWPMPRLPRSSSISRGITAPCRRSATAAATAKPLAAGTKSP